MVPLFKPHMPARLPELDRILHSGSLGYGKWGRAFEAALAGYLCNDRVATVSSYSAAMSVAILAAGIEPGDEVIASPMTCLASSQPLVAHGVKVVWADIDPTTGTLDPDDVSRKISVRTRAIFHNHFCGYMGYVDEINAVGREHGVIVVDDAIEAFGAEYKGRKAGNLGTDITAFSFQTVRMPCTVDGGALVFGRSELFERACLARDWGIDRKRFRDEMDEIDGNCDISVAGIGATMSEVNSYIGYLQLTKIEPLLEAQRRTAGQWPEWLRRHDIDAAVLKPIDGARPNYWVIGMLAGDRRQAIRWLRQAGYYASSVHINNNRYSVFGSCIQLPGVEAFQRRFLAAPCGWWVGSLSGSSGRDGFAGVSSDGTPVADA